MNKDLSVESYMSSLCEEVLGPHFRFVSNGSRTRTGFIYCEHFYGPGFLYLTENNMWNNNIKRKRRRSYPGAVARIDNDGLFILDQTREEDERHIPPGRSYADVERIHFAQPTFLERFKTIIATHKKVCKAQKLRSDGMHRIIV